HGRLTDDLERLLSSVASASADLSHERYLQLAAVPEHHSPAHPVALSVARHLRRSGHAVRFMGYSRRFASEVREAGFAIDLLDPELGEDAADQVIAVDQGRRPCHPFTTNMVRERVASELTCSDGGSP